MPDIDVQNEIVTLLDSQRQVVKSLRGMKDIDQKKINQLLADVWGVEFVEQKKEVSEEVEIN